MSVVLGKLAEPHPDGKVSYFSGGHPPIDAENAHSNSAAMLHGFNSQSSQHWSNDPLYFAAEQVKKNRRQKLLSIR